ncbi:MAG: nucleotidyl transferase AbiEii/AbiGii toxin family protein, partial [Clostridia bacterium]|nr:nucleotidyl transferase AbiEii/AbiGii toxin family protein [Clostridia bacterium]
MFTSENYTADHIREVRERTKADPSIIERTIFAFGLLESISNVGLPFIFKGGTSLIILLEDPHRLSTDIDILVEPGTDIDDYIQRAGVIFPFKRVEENNRKKENNIEKRHFRFYFDSPRSGEEIRVLLDVVFEENPYHNVVEREINSSLLLSEGEKLIVRIPDKNCLPIGKGLKLSPPFPWAHTVRATFIAYGAPSNLSG